MKLYTTSGNCVRAAKTALGAGAVRDVHFKVVKTDEVHRDVGDNHIVDPASFQFFAIDGAPAVPAVEAKVTVGKPAKTKVPKVPKVAKAKKAKAAKPAKAPKAARKKSDGTIGHQKGSQTFLAMASRVNGVSYAEAAERMKQKPWSARGLKSRLAKEFKFDQEKVNGELRISNPRPLHKAAAAHEAAAAGEAAQAA